MTKEELRKAFNDVLDNVEEKGYFDVTDVRKLAENGIPIISICRDKGVFNAIRFCFDKWLNGL